jgi:hypothetical protein
MAGYHFFCEGRPHSQLIDLPPIISKTSNVRQEDKLLMLARYFPRRIERLVMYSV